MSEIEGTQSTTTTDEYASVTTVESKDVQPYQVTLVGELSTLNLSEVEVYIEYKYQSNSWSHITGTTSLRTLSSTQTFEETIDDAPKGTAETMVVSVDIEPNTSYDFRAVVQETDGTLIEKGDTLSFTTPEIVSEFGIVINEVSTPTARGETVEVSTTVSNDGNVDEAKDVWLEYKTQSNEVQRVDNVNINAGKTKEVLMNFDIPKDESVGDQSIWTETPDNIDTRTLTVGEFWFRKQINEISKIDNEEELKVEVQVEVPRENIWTVDGVTHLAKFIANRDIDQPQAIGWGSSTVGEPNMTASELPQERFRKNATFFERDGVNIEATLPANRPSSQPVGISEKAVFTDLSGDATMLLYDDMGTISKDSKIEVDTLFRLRVL